MGLFTKKKPAPAPAAPRLPTVLIVDDDLTIADLNQAVFQGRDWQVKTAYDGTGAISSLNLDKPDLVLLDLMLPDRPGEQVIDAVRSLRMRTKVIVVTGRYVTKKDFEKYEGTVIWVLRKPYPITDLRALIEWVESGEAVTPKLSSVGDV